jgi:hypothetical protein
LNVTLFEDFYELAANTILDKKGKVIGAAIDMRKIEVH